MYDGNASLDNLDDLDNAVDFLQRYTAGPESPNIVLRFDEMEKAFAGSGTDLSGDATKLTGSILTWFQDKRINGIIFLGVPGCGKSELLYAWAKSAGKPVVNVDLPGMQGSLLGQSMANLQAAEKTIDAMGGGRVLAIATVNDVSTLPAPLLRRFNLGTFFFDIPKTESARLKILNIHRKKYGINAKDKAPDMNLWTGSDIECCCKRAYMLQETLEESAKNVVKVMLARREEMDTLRRDANGKYISASVAGTYQYYDPFDVPQERTEGTRRLKG
jgi:SpoVK/Ycf46/Vps4 family AAA+-type ATPase